MTPALIKLRKQIAITPKISSEIFKEYYKAFLNTYTQMRIGYWGMKHDDTKIKFTTELNKMSQTHFKQILNSMDGIMDISGAFEIKYIDAEVKIVDFDTTNEETNLLVLSMMTDFYLLVDDFSDKIIITTKENEDSFKKGDYFAESYFFELPKDVIIGSYKAIK